MAISGTDASRENRVLTTTLDRYSPQISNEIARNDGVVGIFGARGAIKVVTGGQRAVETLDKSENSNFDFRSKYSDVPTGRMDSRTQAKFAWATLDGSVAINAIEKAMNSGDAKIYDLVEAEIMNAKNTIVRKVADALRASSPGAGSPESVLTLIQDNAAASQTGSTGEIARNTTYWFNQYSNTSMDLSSIGGVEALFAFLLQSCAKGTSRLDRPDFGLTSGTIYAALASYGESVRRLQSDQKTMELGFNNVVVDNATIIADPSIASGNLYLLNTNHTKLQVLRTGKMKNIGDRPQTIPVSVEGFEKAYNSLHDASIMHVTMALTSSSLQRNGIATNCS